jgi:hypothetical protein
MRWDAAGKILINKKVGGEIGTPGAIPRESG